MELSYHIKGHLMKKLNLIIISALLSVNITYPAQPSGVYIERILNQTGMNIQRIAHDLTDVEDSGHFLKPTHNELPSEIQPLLVSGELSAHSESVEFTEIRTRFNQYRRLDQYTIYLSLQPTGPGRGRNSSLTVRSTNSTKTIYLTPLIDPTKDSIRGILSLYKGVLTESSTPKFEFTMTEGPVAILRAQIYSDRESDYENNSDDEMLLQ